MSNDTVIRKILYLREQYHFGPGRIATYLDRFHQITIAGSSVHRILKRHGMNRLPANQKHRPYGKRWKRYEKLAPGHRLQVDVKFLERIPSGWTRIRLRQGYGGQASNPPVNRLKRDDLRLIAACCL